MASVALETLIDSVVGIGNVSFKTVTHWPHRLAVRTRPFQGCNRGSIPRGVILSLREIVHG